MILYILNSDVLVVSQVSAEEKAAKAMIDLWNSGSKEIGSDPDLGYDWYYLDCPF